MALVTLNDPASTGLGPVVRMELTTPTGVIAFQDWTRVRITRSLKEIAGSFELEYDDRYRTEALQPPLATRMALSQVMPLMKIRLFIDDELVMIGWTQDVEWHASNNQVRAHFSGLDPGGDVLQCTANPKGPAEYKGLTVDQIATRLLAPFGFSAVVEADVGAPIADFSLDVGETVFSAIDKACKLRAVLPTSNGIGGIVLTRSGSRRAPAPIDAASCLELGQTLSSRNRFSDYYVKGQSRSHGHGAGAPLTHTANPLPSRGAEGQSTSLHAQSQAYRLQASPAPSTPPRVPVSTARAASIINVGHAVDPAVGRYRPKVWVARTGAGGAPHQVLAEWHMRIARARGERYHFTVPDFRAGSQARLWRPNEVVSVQWLDDDPYDMLIEGITYMQDGVPAAGSPGGSRTELAVVGVEAYDLEPLPDGKRRHRGGPRAAAGSNVNRLPK